MVIYLTDPKNSTRELLQLIDNFSNEPRYKINSKKSVAFLYSKHKEAEKELGEMTLIKILTNNLKTLGMTLTKQVRILYDRDLKSMRKEWKKISKD